MTVDKDELLDKLWKKHEALYDMLQDINDRVPPADKPDVEPVVSNGELEIARVEAVYDWVSNDKPVPFPSQEEVDALAEAAGRVDHAVRYSAAIEEVIKAGTTLIKTWPVSKGG